VVTLCLTISLSSLSSFSPPFPPSLLYFSLPKHVSRVSSFLWSGHFLRHGKEGIGNIDFPLSSLVLLFSIPSLSSLFFFTQTCKQGQSFLRSGHFLPHYGKEGTIGRIDFPRSPLSFSFSLPFPPSLFSYTAISFSPFFLPKHVSSISPFLWSGHFLPHYGKEGTIGSIYFARFGIDDCVVYPVGAVEQASWKRN
jgi:hypothetical protein